MSRPLNNDNEFSKMIHNCIWKAALKIQKDIHPTPDIEELVNIGWMYWGRHYKGGYIKMDYVMRHIWRCALEMRDNFNKAGMTTHKCELQGKRQRIAEDRDRVNGSWGEYRRPDAEPPRQLVDEKTLRDDIGDKDLVAKLLACLSKRDRRMVEMYICEGCTCVEIGKKFNVCHQAVSHAIIRSLKMLKETDTFRLATE